MWYSDRHLSLQCQYMIVCSWDLSPKPIGSMSSDLIERLIIEIEKHPSIYDKSLSEYKDVDKKEDIWKKIAGKLSIGGK